MQMVENPPFRKGDFDDPIFYIEPKLRIQFKEKTISDKGDYKWSLTVLVYGLD